MQNKTIARRIAKGRAIAARRARNNAQNAAIPSIHTSINVSAAAPARMRKDSAVSTSGMSSDLLTACVEAAGFEQRQSYN